MNVVVCLLTLAQHGFGQNGTEEALIYTDAPTRFEVIAPWVRTRLLNEGEIAEWKGPNAFVHRHKIKMLEEVLDLGQYEKILYLDTDILALKPVSTLWAGIDASHTLMHAAEHRLDSKANPIISKMHRFARRGPVRLPNGDTYKIPLNALMLNAGVLGLHGTHLPLVRRVLALSDAMHAAYQKHVMEQLAFSLVLQEATHVATTEDTFLHYWYHKPFREAISVWLHAWGTAPLEVQLAHLPALDFNAHYAAYRPAPKKKWWRFWR